MHCRRWLGALVLVLAWIGAAHAEPRIALVIGNAHYSGPMLPVLKTPANDAELMAKTLTKLGFVVIEVEDADWGQMKRAIQDFGDKLASAGPAATSLFFYSGHGIQVSGQSYLVPRGADIQKESDVLVEAVSASDVLDQVAFAGSRTNIVIVDASQNNPLQRGFRSVAGLARPGGDFPDTFISLSAAPGTVAEDGHGPHSAFVAALAEAMLTPGLTIHEVFESVRVKVLVATKYRQVTWESSTLTAPFHFVPQN
jgi:carboxyl-terminal processing protease